MTVEVCPFGSSAVIFYYCTIWENPAWTCCLSEWMIYEKFKIKFFVHSSTCWLHLESLGRSRCLPGNPFKFMLLSAKSKKYKTAKQKLRNNSIVILLAKLFLVEAPITIGVKLLEDCFSPKDKHLHKALWLKELIFCPYSELGNYLDKIVASCTKHTHQSHLSIAIPLEAPSKL